jgi:hypothetical protein
MVIGATGDQPRTKKPITFQERLGDDHLNETGHPHGRSIFLVICVGMAVLERRAERQKCNGPVLLRIEAFSCATASGMLILTVSTSDTFKKDMGY